MKQKIDIELIKKAQEGDQQLREQILSSCEYIVASEVKKINVDPTEKEDLAQIGRCTIIVAIDKYNPKYGASFETFATTCVRHKLLDALKYIPKFIPIDETHEMDGEGVDPNIINILRELFSPIEFQIIMMWAYDYSYDEIVKDLNVKHTKIANTITKLKKLKDKIRKEAGI